jgi:hypothetical protein
LAVQVTTSCVISNPSSSHTGVNLNLRQHYCASIPLSLRSFAYALPVLHYIFLSQNGLCSPSKLSAFIARQPRFRLPNLHLPALGVYINRVQRAHLIVNFSISSHIRCQRSNTCIAPKKKRLLSTQQHTYSVFSASFPSLNHLGHFGLPNLHPPPGNRHFLSPLTGTRGMN